MTINKCESYLSFASCQLALGTKYKLASSASCTSKATQGSTCKVHHYFIFLLLKRAKNYHIFQEVHREVPYSSSKEVCTQSQLWTYTHTVPTYPWVPVTSSSFFVVRTGLEGPCDDLVAEELTDEDLEVCEVVCLPAMVKECAKVLNGTDEEGNEVWEDDQEACVELEKTECKVQERKDETEEKQDGEISEEVPDSDNTATTTTTPKPTTKRAQDVKSDDSAIIFG